jgi:hypothetical protein
MLPNHGVGSAAEAGMVRLKVKAMSIMRIVLVIGMSLKT